MQNQEKKLFLQIGALWVRTSKAGNEYTSGTISREKIVEALNKTVNSDLKIMLTANRKTAQNHPDYKIVATEVEYVRPQQSPAQALGLDDSQDSVPF